MSDLEKTVAYQNEQIQALTKLVDMALANMEPEDRKTHLGGLGNAAGRTQIGRGTSMPTTSIADALISRGWDDVIMAVLGS